MLNCTLDQTPSQIILASHNTSAIPALIIFYIGINAILLFSGLFLIKGEGNHPYRKFFIIWSVFAFISGLFLLYLIYSPFTIQDISTFFMSIFK